MRDDVPDSNHVIPIPELASPKVVPKPLASFPYSEPEKRVPVLTLQAKGFSIGDGIRLAAGVWIFSLLVFFAGFLFWTIVLERVGLFDGLFR